MAEEAEELNMNTSKEKLEKALLLAQIQQSQMASAEFEYDASHRDNHEEFSKLMLVSARRDAQNADRQEELFELQLLQARAEAEEAGLKQKNKTKDEAFRGFG